MAIGLYSLLFGLLDEDRGSYIEVELNPLEQVLSALDLNQPL
jgi:hypothetical protein